MENNNLRQEMYKNTEEINSLNSENFKNIFENQFKEDMASDFKKLTLAERDRLLNELEQFKNEITITRLEVIKESIEYFKKNSLNWEDKWKAIKNRTLNPISINEPLKIDNQNFIENVNIMNDNDIISSKPLGKFGDKTLNELIKEGGEMLLPFKEYFENTGINPGSVIPLVPLFFMYKGVVNLFDKAAFKPLPENLSAEQLLKYKIMRARELRLFMIIGAPMIVASLYTIKNLSGGIGIRIDRPTETAVNNTEIQSEGLLNSGLILFIKNLPSWVKSLVLITISMLSLNYIINATGGNNSLNTNIQSILLSNIFWVKLFFIIGIIILIISILYLILNIFLFIMFSENKIRVSKYYPQFIIDWLKGIQELSKDENKGIFIEFYFRLIFIYLFIFLSCLIALYNIW